MLTLKGKLIIKQKGENRRSLKTQAAIWYNYDRAVSLDRGLGFLSQQNASKCLCVTKRSPIYIYIYIYIRRRSCVLRIVVVTLVTVTPCHRVTGHVQSFIMHQQNNTLCGRTINDVDSSTVFYDIVGQLLLLLHAMSVDCR